MAESEGRPRTVGSVLEIPGHATIETRRSVTVKRYDGWVVQGEELSSRVTNGRADATQSPRSIANISCEIEREQRERSGTNL